MFAGVLIAAKRLSFIVAGTQAIATILAKSNSGLNT